jgi:hypothetical protein
MLARTVDPSLMDAVGSWLPAHPASASAENARTATLNKARFMGSPFSDWRKRTIRTPRGCKCCLGNPADEVNRDSQMLETLDIERPLLAASARSP